MKPKLCLPPLVRCMEGDYYLARVKGGIQFNNSGGFCMVQFYAYDTRDMTIRQLNNFNAWASLRDGYNYSNSANFHKI